MCIWHNQVFLLRASEVRGLSRTLYCQDWLSGLSPRHRTDPISQGAWFCRQRAQPRWSWPLQLLFQVHLWDWSLCSCHSARQLVRSTRKMSPSFLMARVLRAQHRGRAGTPQTLITTGSEEEDRRKERRDTEGKHREIIREK